MLPPSAKNNGSINLEGINPSVWAHDTVGRARRAPPVVVKLRPAYNHPNKKQYQLSKEALAGIK